MHRAYEGIETRQLVLDLGFIPVVPPLRTRVEPRGNTTCDRTMYMRRRKLGIVFIAIATFALVIEGMRSLNTP